MRILRVFSYIILREKNRKNKKLFHKLKLILSKLKLKIGKQKNFCM